MNRLGPLFFLLPLGIPLLAAQNTPSTKQSEIEMSARVWAMTNSELKQLVSKARSGDPEAQYWLGIKCEEGQIEDMEPQEAPTWFLKSAEQGFAPAQRKYGMLMVHENPPVGERWLLHAAELFLCTHVTQP